MKKSSFPSSQIAPVLLILSLVLGACAPGNSTQESGQAASTATPALAAATETPAPAATTAPEATATLNLTPQASPTPSVEPGLTFQSPVMKLDFPDPFILPVGEQYYAYATNSAGRNVQVAVSEDLITWKLLTDAMPALPKWASLTGGFVWAPEVMQVGDQFLLYFTARDKEADKQCIGVAASAKPEGKFKDTRSEPLVCQETQGGSIDASPYREGDKLYLFWKNDGNCCGRTTWIYVQEMAPDGLSLVGEPVQLVSNDKPWEGMVIEAPTMWKHADQYYLFYSANNYGGVEYAVGYALCETVTGPCEDAPENPILKSHLKKPPVIGPGHQTLLQVGDEIWIIYHAWEVTLQGVKTDRRFVWMDRLEFENGKPVVEGPPDEVQPVPDA